MAREKVTDAVLVVYLYCTLIVFSYSISKITIHIATHVFIYSMSASFINCRKLIGKLRKRGRN